MREVDFVFNLGDPWQIAKIGVPLRKARKTRKTEKRKTPKIMLKLGVSCTFSCT